MRKIFLSAAIVLFMAAACSPEYIVNPEEYVSTLVGSDSDFSFSNGNTYPAIALPWGMNFWTPQTGQNGDGWQYTYRAHVLRALGFYPVCPASGEYALCKPMFPYVKFDGSLLKDKASRKFWKNLAQESKNPTKNFLKYE